MTSTDSLQKLDEAIALMRKTGAGPKPKDLFDGLAWDMSNAHGMMLIGLRHMYAVSGFISLSIHTANLQLATIELTLVFLRPRLRRQFNPRTITTLSATACFGRP